MECKVFVLGEGGYDHAWIYRGTGNVRATTWRSGLNVL